MTTESLPRTLVLIAGALFCLTTIPGGDRGGAGNLIVERVTPVQRMVPVSREWMLLWTVMQAEWTRCAGRPCYVVRLLADESDRIAFGPGGGVRCNIQGDGLRECVVHRMPGTDGQGFTVMTIEITGAGRDPPGGGRISMALPLWSATRRAVIPRDAVVFSDEVPWVLTVDAHEPRWRPVGLGDVNDDCCEVLFGIDDSDSVAVGPRQPTDRSLNIVAHMTHIIHGRPSPDQGSWRPIP